MATVIRTQNEVNYILERRLDILFERVLNGVSGVRTAKEILEDLLRNKEELDIIVDNKITATYNKRTRNLELKTGLMRHHVNNEYLMTMKKVLDFRAEINELLNVIDVQLVRH